MKVQHISFINTHKTIEEAEVFSNKIVGPSCIIHLWNSDGTELFTVCQQSALDGMVDMIKDHTDFKTELAHS